MKPLAATLSVIESVNSRLLALGRHIAWVLVLLMVLTILLQVFMRYVIGSALPWPEEVARALMIWMTALVAASGYRWGAFVAIDLISDVLPKRTSQILKLILLLLAMVLLVELFVLAIEFFQRGFRTRAASFPLKRAWIYLAMPVCFGSMILVNVELFLRQLGRICGNATDFPDPVNPMLVDESPVAPGE